MATHHSHGGAIAGGVVGGLVGLALLVGLCYILYKKLQPRETGTYDSPVEENMAFQPPGAINPPLKQYVSPIVLNG